MHSPNIRNTRVAGAALFGWNQSRFLVRLLLLLYSTHNTAEMTRSRCMSASQMFKFFYVLVSAMSEEERAALLYPPRGPNRLADVRSVSIVANIYDDLLFLLQ